MFQQAIGLPRGFDLIPYFANLFLLKLAVDELIQKRISDLVENYFAFMVCVKSILSLSFY